jgi:hypothetical protein
MTTKKNKAHTACDSCGAPIIWIEDQNGTIIPLNKTRVRIYNIDADGNGWFVEEITNGKPRLNHISHFLTCPNATHHSKKADTP